MCLSLKIYLIRSFSLSVVVFLISFSAFSASVELEPIVIEKEKSIQSDNLLSSGDKYLQLNDSDSPQTILSYYSSIDLEERSGFGIQQDLSIRGNLFEDNDVLINGISVKDPQTGHYSLTIPFLSSDLEKVRVQENSNSVEFILKEPTGNGGQVSLLWGEHALSGESLSLNFGLKSLKNRISLTHKKSKGSRRDTDFDLYKFSLRSLWRTDSKSFDLIYGLLKKDFGADGFYAGPVYTQEEEHIVNSFLSLKTETKSAWGNLEITPFYRRYQDKFILDRKNPSFYTNYHTNYIYGLKNKIEISDFPFYLGLSLKKEKITSTNLGNHTRYQRDIRLGLKERALFSRILFKGWIENSYLSQSQNLSCYHLESVYNIEETKFLTLSLDKVFRLPSFTELYYFSPANKGNAELGVQESLNYNARFTYSKNNFLSSLEIFYRQQEDTIDWVRQDSALPWQAKNIGNVNVLGFEYNLDAKFNTDYLKEIKLGYTYLSLNKDNPYKLSKYAFDFLQHKLSFLLSLSLSEDISLYPFFIFEKPANDSCRIIADLKLEYRPKEDIAIFFKGDNIFNAGYTELPGIKASDSWWVVGVEYNF